MPYLIPVPAQSNQKEWLDGPDIAELDLENNFRDIRLINRWFGGVRLMERCLKPLVSPADTDLTWLDLAAGAADVPLALAKRWQPRIKLAITAVDLNPAIAEIARRAAQNAGVINFETHAADIFDFNFDSAGGYGFETGAGPRYDFVTCSLALHHFNPAQRVALLRLMSRLARRGFVVSDLHRSWFGFLGAYLLGWTLTRHRLTRHDAPLSVLRAFTPPELTALIGAADLSAQFEVQVKRGIFSRLAIVGKRV